MLLCSKYGVLCVPACFCPIFNARARECVLIGMNRRNDTDNVDGAAQPAERPLNIMFSLYYESGEDMEEAVAPPPEKVSAPHPDACEALPQLYNGAA